MKTETKGTTDFCGESTIDFCCPHTIDWGIISDATTSRISTEIGDFINESFPSDGWYKKRSYVCRWYAEIASMSMRRVAFTSFRSTHFPFQPAFLFSMNAF